MTFLEALFLGVLQGLTEFLPVSSSGHLKLAQALLGFEHLDRYILFDLVCHLGTLCATFTLFFKPILNLFKKGQELRLLLIATLPLFPLVLIIKPIKHLFDAPHLLGFFFLITAVFLFAATLFGWNADPDSLNKRRWRDALLIGLSQAVAILPGISRSGSTVSTARILGWDAESAVRFSVLMAIPAIIGGVCYELLSLLKPNVSATIATISWSSYLIGFLSSYLIGLLSLVALIRVVLKDKLYLFGWYCLFLGIFALAYFN